MAPSEEEEVAAVLKGKQAPTFEAPEAVIVTPPQRSPTIHLRKPRCNKMPLNICRSDRGKVKSLPRSRLRKICEMKSQKYRVQSASGLTSLS
jgi:hypothetical protein